MKYYLCIDKGEFQRRDKRFEKIPLHRLSEIDVGYNLKRLCTFTMTFENEWQLKEFLVAKGLLPKRYKYFNLVIMYQAKNIKTMSVPYASEEILFDIGILTHIIVKEAQNNGQFMDLFLDAFCEDKYKPEEYYELKEVYNDPYALYLLFDKVLAFLNRKCYKVKNGEEYFSYKSLCEIVLLVKNLQVRSIKQESVPVRKKSINTLDSAAEFKLEEWQTHKDNDLDGQLSLFRG